MHSWHAWCSSAGMRHASSWLLLAAVALVACGSDVDHHGGGSGGSSTSSPTGVFGGSDCTGLCEQSEACGNQPGTDCAKACADAEVAADKAGCRAEFDAFVDCFAGIDDVCAMNNTECSSEASAYINCTNPQPGPTGSGGGG